MPEIIEVARCFTVKGLETCSTNSCRLDDGKIIPNRKIVWGYVCAECEHGLTETIDDVRCPECGSHSIISRDLLSRQRVQAVEVLRGLPQELQAAALAARPKTIDTDTAINALLGAGTPLPQPSPSEEEQLRTAKINEFMREKHLLKGEK